MQKGDWRSWLARHREQSSMRAEVVPISQVGDWQVLVDESGQAVSVGRADKKFHEAVTVRVSNARREVPDYSTLLFREATKPGEEGVMVLVGDGQGNFLIQAKAEPGNDTEGKVLLAATLQVSRANLGQAHGGGIPPRAELFGQVDPARWCLIRADGARFLSKRNLFAVAIVDRGGFETSESERWFTDVELCEALQDGEVGELLAHAWLAALKMPRV